MTASKNQLYIQALEHRAALNYPFIGITGSNGKTTTKRMLAAILSQAGRVYEFGDDSDWPGAVARELVSLPDAYRWALVKLGAAEPTHLFTSAQLIKPKIAIITNIGEAHFARYGSYEKIAMEKRQILRVLDADGTIILNRDNEHTRGMGEFFSGRVLYFGLGELADYAAQDIEYLGPQGTRFKIARKNGPSFVLQMPIYSEGDVYNALAAIAAADQLDIADDLKIRGLGQHFFLPDGRGVMHACNGNIHILDDTHDATPQSLLKSTKALLHFRSPDRRLILIMGDMTDLGQQSERMHEMMGHYLAGMPIDVVVLIGRDILKTAQALESETAAPILTKIFTHVDDARDYLLQAVRNNDAIMVEGSGTEDMAGLVHEMVAHFECRPSVVNDLEVGGIQRDHSAR